MDTESNRFTDEERILEDAFRDMTGQPPEEDILESAFRDMTGQPPKADIPEDVYPNTTCQPRPEPHTARPHTGSHGGKYAAAPQGGLTAEQKKWILIVTAAIGGIVLMVGLVFGILALQKPGADKAPTLGRVTAGSVNLYGLTEEEARSALHRATDGTYTRENMVISLPEERISLPPADTGAALDVNKAVDAAFALSKTAGNDPVVLDLVPYLNLNTAVIETAIRDLGAKYNTDFVQTQWTIEGVRPSLTPPESGIPPEGQTLVITLGRPGYGLDAAALLERVMAAYSSNVFLVEAEYTAVTPELPDLQALYDEHYIAPIDAVMNEEDFTPIPDVYGYGFDLENAQAMLDAAQDGDVIEIPFVCIPADVTLEDLSSPLYRDVLGSYRTKLSGNDNHIANQKQACAAINGKILMPDELFSFNEALGERTTAKGYRPAVPYKDSPAGEVIGGGICQSASTLYAAALLADLQITQRTEHTYQPDYIDLGLDADIKWNTIDLKFRNNTDYPIRIVAEVSGGYVEFRLMGTDTKDYYVELSCDILRTRKYSTVTQVMSPDNSAGYVNGQVITTPFTGYEVATYRCRYSKETKARIEKVLEAESVYEKRDQVICRIEVVEIPTEPPTDPPTEPPTDPPTDPPTEPPTDPPAVTPEG